MIGHWEQCPMIVGLTKEDVLMGIKETYTKDIIDPNIPTCCGMPMTQYKTDVRKVGGIINRNYRCQKCAKTVVKRVAGKSNEI